MEKGVFLPLRAAVAQILRMNGLPLLDDDKKFYSCLLDVADRRLPEVDLLAQQADANIIEFLRQAAQQPDAMSLKTAQAKVLDVLENERYVKEDLAESVSKGLVGGLADYLGIAYLSAHSNNPPAAIPAPAPAPSSKPAPSPTPTSTLSVTPKPVPKPTPVPPPTSRTKNIQPPPPVAPPQQPKKKTGLIVALALVAAIAVVAVVAVVFLVGPGKGEHSSWSSIGPSSHSSSNSVLDSSADDTQVTSSAEEENKTYRIVSDLEYLPFEYIADDGSYAGIDMELLDAIARDQGFTYEIVSKDFDKLGTEVVAGKADGIISCYTVTPERGKQLDFSDPYYSEYIEGEKCDYAFAVKKGANAKLLKMFNDGLAHIKANGTYDAIFKKYEKELKSISTS